MDQVGEQSFLFAKIDTAYPALVFELKLVKIKIGQFTRLMIINIKRF